MIEKKQIIVSCSYPFGLTQQCQTDIWHYLCTDVLCSVYRCAVLCAQIKIPPLEYAELILWILIQFRSEVWSISLKFQIKSVFQPHSLQKQETFIQSPLTVWLVAGSNPFIAPWNTVMSHWLTWLTFLIPRLMSSLFRIVECTGLFSVVLYLCAVCWCQRSLVK